MIFLYSNKKTNTTDLPTVPARGLGGFFLTKLIIMFSCDCYGPPQSLRLCIVMVGVNAVLDAAAEAIMQLLYLLTLMKRRD